jgi:hypothetical protein
MDRLRWSELTPFENGNQTPENRFSDHFFEGVRTPVLTFISKSLAASERINPSFIPSVDSIR